MTDKRCIGILEELELSAGDKFVSATSLRDTVYTVNSVFDGGVYISWGGEYPDNNFKEVYSNSTHVYRIISRASDTPKIWRDMTDAEKGALLLAFHNGEEIEFLHYAKKPIWDECGDGVSWDDDVAYRIAPKKPVVETITLYGNVIEFTEHFTAGDSYKITVQVNDGTPDCDSVKMEAIQ